MFHSRFCAVKNFYSTKSGMEHVLNMLMNGTCISKPYEWNMFYSPTN